MMGNGGMVFGGGFMWIFWLLVIVVLVIVTQALMSGGSQTDEIKQSTALDILMDRQITPTERSKSCSLEPLPLNLPSEAFSSAPLSIHQFARITNQR